MRPLKTVTTPHDLTVCFSNVIEAAAAEFEAEVTEFLTTVDCIRYSTTIGTNAIIEREGANVGMLAPPALLDRLEASGVLVRDILVEGSQRSLEAVDDSGDLR